ncbi:DUF11 domain-containing protein [Erythrobacter sp. KMU-140]|uniref:DUF11 domain-containing protein n=2 Tax=Erythrobacter rubeus TaxID=2760803 RepID=A0ABR8KMU8_9SPHN|nr:DUF11 domain-containing protein [Erythrobacter rubeus]
MLRHAHRCLHSLAVILLVLVASLLAAANEARAQDAEIDWADAGVSSLTPFPSGTTVAGSDGTTATVTWSVETEGSGSFDPAFGGDFVSYFSGTVGGNPSPLVTSFDNSSFDPRDKITITITLDRAVRNLRFTVSDIDSGPWRDAIEVFHSPNLSGAFSNAASTNSFWTANTTVSRTNDATVNGWTGIGASATAASDGNLAFDFGSTEVRQIRIVYFSYTGTGDPIAQFATVSDLVFGENSADLSLAKQLIGSAPTNGGAATWRLTVSNASTSGTTANGILVRDAFPPEFSFTNASGDGTFNSGTGEWSVGALAPGTSASIDLTGRVVAPAGTTITNTAEIVASSVDDPDSTVNNAITSEDDYASSSFTVATNSAGVPPELFCPNGTSFFRWGSISWPRGSTSNSYTLGTLGTIGFSITNEGAWVPVTRYGGAVPGTSATMTGGFSDGGSSLIYHVNRDNRVQQSVTTITLPQLITGAQFQVFDVDSSSGFEDRVTVYGQRSGVRVDALLTGSASNTVSGDTALGNGGSSDTQGLGNVTVTFSDPVDTIIIEYGNGPGAPANPTNQGIGLHDLAFCTPSLPSLSVTKISSIISDPVNGTTNPKAIPGAIVEYLISVQNSGDGSSDADSVFVTDVPSGDTTLCLLPSAGGPVRFSDGSGSSGLTYNFQTLSSAADDLEFSNDSGSTWTYTPVADGDGCDQAITAFRVNPKGTFLPAGAFELRARFRVE